jgi:hypothetical protein
MTMTDGAPSVKPWFALIDELEMHARHAGMSREDFVLQYDYFFNAPPSHRCYVFKGPDWLVFARHIEPKDVPENPPPGDCWLIWWYADRGKRGYDKLFHFSDLVYPLPWVSFARPRRGRKDLQYFPFDRIRRLCEASSTPLSGS